MHGSDWPFPANALVFWNRLHPLTLLDLMAERNLFLRDLRLKQALGLPPESFALAAEVLEVGREAALAAPKNAAWQKISSVPEAAQN